MATVKVTHTRKMQFTGINEAGLSAAMDAPVEHGGEMAGIGPMDMILISLGGCTGMDVIDILRKKRQEVTGYEMNITGKRAEEHPKVYTNIRIEHVVRGKNILPAAVKRAVELSTEKYCSVIGMLKHVVDIDVSFRIEEE